MKKVSIANIIISIIIVIIAGVLFTIIDTI